MSKDKKTILQICQVYPPDPAAVGQYMADVGKEMVRRGFRVVALTANRGFDDPAIRYESQEEIMGVAVKRLPMSSFGKKSLLFRLFGGILFTIQAAVRGLFTRDLGGILVTTIPPMASLSAVLISKIRRVPIIYWLMDLNPDQVVSLGYLKPSALPVKLFEAMNRLILGTAQVTVVLDRFMADRVSAKLPGKANRVTVIPPWPLSEHVQPIARDENWFRVEHGWQDKTVIMYSGNHGIASPTKTFLDAALALPEQADVVFAFIGGGVAKGDVDRAIAERQPKNIVSLPYQPLEITPYSLSAADVHVVSVGNEIVGINHPSKVYGAMALGKPILYFGPPESHVVDMARDTPMAWSVAHGDVEGAMSVVQQIAEMSPEELDSMGQSAQATVNNHFSTAVLRNDFCDRLAGAIRGS